MPDRPSHDSATDPPGGSPAALRLTTPTDVIAVLPYLAGGPPDPGLVVLALQDGRVHTVLRADLNGQGAPPGSPSAPPVVDHAVAERCDALLVVAFGPPDRVTPYVDALVAAARERGITVIDALRVTDGRYWSYTCVDPSCCPPEGTVVDVDRSTAPADAVLHGITPLSPVHASRAESARVRALLEPVAGPLATEVAAAAEDMEDLARDRAARGSDAWWTWGFPRCAPRFGRRAVARASPSPASWPLWACT
ncbi:hypothetical protein BJF83_20120 [Nocardiopsis sp. CNR-923]|nr:hypothetical protein BJF83_20120 [Nocardiopsis sp. CNR-923]